MIADAAGLGAAVTAVGCLSGTTCGDAAGGAAANRPLICLAVTHSFIPARQTGVSGVILPSAARALMRLSPNGPQEFPPMTTYQSDGMQSSHWLQMRTDQSGTTKNDSARNPPVSGR